MWVDAGEASANLNRTLEEVASFSHMLWRTQHGDEAAAQAAGGRNRVPTSVAERVLSRVSLPREPVPTEAKRRLDDFFRIPLAEFCRLCTTGVHPRREPSFCPSAKDSQAAASR
mmetsp:Transcript_9612/g.29103  ORF Transcript_9612/g.29103 Transcript_9612/m.29103 type:complete len:114 (-) Transcript_9612:1706-2047(-)